MYRILVHPGNPKKMMKYISDLNPIWNQQDHWIEIELDNTSEFFCRFDVNDELKFKVLRVDYIEEKSNSLTQKVKEAEQLPRIKDGHLFLLMPTIKNLR